MDECEGLWARSEALTDGTYGVAITYGADIAWTLAREQAVAYSVACHQIAITAEHDAAVFGLLRSTGLPERTAGAFIVEDLRPGRRFDDAATAPLRFRPALGLRAGPFITLHVNGEQVGELSPADLLDHSSNVLVVLAAADLDTRLHTALIDRIGLDDARARAAVGSLSKHLPERGTPRSG